ncbi:MAG: 4-alpha-glucanotransferase, partial [Actinomycetes bacterium]
MHDEGSTPDRWGVTPGWWATDGAWRTTEPATVDALHQALGADEFPAGPPRTDVRFIAQGNALQLDRPQVLRLEDGTELGRSSDVPGDLPLGAHELVSDDGTAAPLFVVPPRAPAPARSWGWTAQLYGARSERSWGHGDLGDLATLAAWAADCGATWLAHEPLGAFIPPASERDRLQNSPYSASSRRFP